MSAALRIRPQENPLVEAASFVLSLRGRGISDLAVLRAMERVPRELFAPRRYLDLARQDIALPLAAGQTMTSPAVVAQMLVALEVRPGHRVLEIGSGSGYVGALLSHAGAQVRSCERNPMLADSAAERLRQAGFAATCDVVVADGFAAEACEGRFDRILLNGSVEALPPSLTSRIAGGGRLVCGLRSGGTTRLLAVGRDRDGQLVGTTGQAVRIARLVCEQAPQTGAPATEA